MGGISGNQASISEILTWTDSVVHTIESTNFQLNPDNSIDFSYREKVFSSPVFYKHYKGHYTK